MSINSINSAGQTTLPKIGFQGNNKKEEQKDPFYQYPRRALAYTNEVGVAIQPVVNPWVSLGFWAPALAYFAADIHDKYKKGDENGEKNTQKAVSTGAFHAAASVFGPSGAILLAQKAFTKIGGEKFKLVEKIDNFVEKTAKNKDKNAFTKIFAKMFDGTKDATVKELPGPLAKISKIPFLGHFLVSDPKDGLKELKKINGKLPKMGTYKLMMGLKAATGFAALAALAKPIDKLTENVLIEKVVNPALGLKGPEHHESKSNHDDSSSSLRASSLKKNDSSNHEFLTLLNKHR